MRSTITVEELIAEVDRLSQKGDSRSEGFKTRKEWQASWGDVSTYQANALLDLAFGLGVLETSSKLVDGKSGRAQRVPAYRFKFPEKEEKTKKK